jgi:5-methylthioadenosine/S-adenosylhomocysteine deaminase
VIGQLVFCEKGSSVDTVIVNGEIVVQAGELKTVVEQEVLQFAEKARTRIDPAIQREFAATAAVEGALAEMYFKVFH